ncbi:MAG: hypothetical protein ACRD2G_10285, partial [Terriglobia bacterium]
PKFSYFPLRPALFEWQKMLRKIWETRAADLVIFALAEWTDQLRKNNWPAWIFDIRQRPAMSPNYGVFALSLAVGVAEALPKMAVCANRECPQKYFLKSRTTQRFCDRPACAACGQREHKREWWRKHGQEWKAKQEAKRDKPSEKSIRR